MARSQGNLSFRFPTLSVSTYRTISEIEPRHPSLPKAQGLTGFADPIEAHRPEATTLQQVLSASVPRIDP